MIGRSPLAALRHRALPALLVVTALAGGGALSGCGGQAEEVRQAGAYADRVNRIQQTFEQDLQRLNKTVPLADKRADVDRAVRRLRDSIDGVERQLQGVKPPSVVADAHAALVEAFARWKAPLDEFRRSLRDREPRATLRAKTRFDTETATVEARVNDARRRINEGLRSLAD
ncbi:hypothetical protein PAI11_20660 [Patulibacter medicamentivorans]|uniref:Lipoprotein n=1 Tax=Patulibacter medicamentivorans TaxID=1097667 RepID=H0E5H5_9ACTN|nr:hypothetical protein [Patulibacter medicamentivorans]EHN11069.1 hypothetical protein PAI11_20660 [Patulibacter medicamentivorans]